MTCTISCLICPAWLSEQCIPKQPVAAFLCTLSFLILFSYMLFLCSPILLFCLPGPRDIQDLDFKLWQGLLSDLDGYFTEWTLQGSSCFSEFLSWSFSFGLLTSSRSPCFVYIFFVILLCFSLTWKPPDPSSSFQHLCKWFHQQNLTLSSPFLIVKIEREHMTLQVDFCKYDL